SIVAQTNCARLLRVNGPKEFADAGKPPTGRPDVAESKLKVPSLIFDEKFVLDDGKQRVEFLFFGHAHTSGDAFAYLPKQKIVCTGDACVNGAFNFMGHSDSASWIRVLEKCQQLDVNLVLPGHGPPAGKELLEKQKRYFVELRQQVKKGIDAGQHFEDIKNKNLPQQVKKGIDPGWDFEDIKKNINMPWYKEWTTVDPSPANVQHVYDEMTGRVAQWDLVEDFGLYEGPSPTKDSPGWTKPRRIIVPNLMPARLAELKRLAPEIEFIPVKTPEDAEKAVEDADAIIGIICSPDIFNAGKKLRWIQLAQTDVSESIWAELTASRVVVTNTQRIYGAEVADHAFALLLALTRGTHYFQNKVLVPPASKKDDSHENWDILRKEVLRLRVDAESRHWVSSRDLPELHGKTMVVVGLGGIGTQIARRAHAFGMRVVAIDPKDMEKPSFVFALAKPEKMTDLLPEADVVVLACPRTRETRWLINKKDLSAMKRSAYLINVAHGELVQTNALVEALKTDRLAGAGLDVFDFEPLADGHPLWTLPNVVISPHVGGKSAGGEERQWRLLRENIRRFVAGEALLGVVDKGKGF
ncbi:MAG TPA: NAD(P)-dependent oxidoreductase, partial [Gemmataceae bacterium]|nr:NAD(P)-dependent oxidoreductase [Gemmataceae bacterium]